MSKTRFQLRPSKIALLPAIWLLVASYLYSFVSSRLQLPKSIDYIVFSLLAVFFGAIVLKIFAAFIDILPEGLRCSYPIGKKMSIAWEDIKSAGAFTKKTPFGTESWLYISTEEAPPTDKVFAKPDGKTIYAIDRPELRAALEKNGIHVRT